MTPDLNIFVAGENSISICPDLPPIILLSDNTFSELSELGLVVIDENKNVLPVPS